MKIDIFFPVTSCQKLTEIDNESKKATFVKKPDSDGKESFCNLGNLGSIPGLGRSLEEGMATHSSVLARRIPMDRGA